MEQTGGGKEINDRNRNKEMNLSSTAGFLQSNSSCSITIRFSTDLFINYTFSSFFSYIRIRVSRFIPGPDTPEVIQGLYETRSLSLSIPSHPMPVARSTSSVFILLFFSLAFPRLKSA